MNNKYGSIPLEPGSKMYGISSLYIAPREWLNPWVVDFDTNIIINTLSLLPDKYWLQLSFAPNSYDYSDDTKIVKGGSYYEIKASGIVNVINPQLHQILETLRYHEVVVVLTDMRKQQRVVGNTEAAMVLTISNATNNASNGTQDITVSLAMDSETSPNYYTGVPIPAIGLLLQNGLGVLLDDGIGDHLLIK